MSADESATQTSGRWSIDPDPEQRDLGDDRIAACLDVFRDGMGLARGWSAEGVRQAMDSASLAAYLHDGDQMVGSAHYDAIDVPGDSLARIVLWERSVCLRKRYQGLGHGSTALRMAFASVSPTRSIGWFGGRTQNPVVFSRYQATVVLPGRLMLDVARRLPADRVSLELRATNRTACTSAAAVRSKLRSG